MKAAFLIVLKIIFPDKCQLRNSREIFRKSLIYDSDEELNFSSWGSQGLFHIGYPAMRYLQTCILFLKQ